MPAAARHEAPWNLSSQTCLAWRSRLATARRCLNTSPSRTSRHRPCANCGSGSCVANMRKAVSPREGRQHAIDACSDGWVRHWCDPRSGDGGACGDAFGAGFGGAAQPAAPGAEDRDDLAEDHAAVGRPSGVVPDRPSLGTGAAGHRRLGQPRDAPARMVTRRPSPSPRPDRGSRSRPRRRACRARGRPPTRFRPR